MAKDRSILIVTQEYDFHADVMVGVLTSVGHPPVRLHTADFPMQAVTTVTFDQQQWTGVVELADRTVDIRDVRSIWWRRPSRYRMPLELSEDEQAFARLEMSETLRGLWDMLDCYWVSHPSHIRDASHKPEQLSRAASLGFDIPSTLVTNNPERVRQFYDRHNGAVVYKVLSDPFLGFSLRSDEIMAQWLGGGSAPDPELAQVRGVHTTVVTGELLAKLDSVRMAPCQFQEYVPKRFELRVTVIGDEIFAAEIHSQDDERTRHDWRRYDVDIPYCKAELPPEIADRCHALTKSYGLNFGAIDLIVTPDDRYVFLEINPNGQWLWVQDLVPELRMKEALASCLINGRSLA